MLNIIFLIAIAFNVFASYREEAKSILIQHESISSPLRKMDKISQSFLGLPYGQGGPLGEGENGRYDQDPLYRFDTFDCTTYVETMIALALARDVDEFESLMDKIRYENSEVDYLKRNHFPSLQWVPNNVRNSLLKEVNHKILPASQMKIAEAVINLPGWLKAIKINEIRVPLATMQERQSLLEELHSYSSQYSPTIARIEYLPLSTLLANPRILKNIPDGAIVNFVRPNWDLTDVAGTHMNVSHQSLVFHKKNDIYIRHASTSGEGRVMELLLLEYLKKFENHPTLKGIHVMEVNWP